MRIEFLIKQIRLEKGMTLKDLSYKTGISTTHLWDIENNYKMPSIINVVLIAKALKVDIKDTYVIFFY